MDLRVWLEKQAPDFLATWQRFPLAIVLTALGAAVSLGALNDVAWLKDEFWLRATVGLGLGTICAIAGVYFRESRPESTRAGFVLANILPFVAILLAEVPDGPWLVPWALPAVSILWLSVSPFTRIGRGEARELQQNRFWWVNHQAFATAVIAAGGYLIICLGLFAIERSLSILFGFSQGDIFYRWLLPFTGLFLTPVYWLSTLRRLAEFETGVLDKPEFTSRAIGFLGQFVLVPLLLIYGLILLAYTAQIVLTRHVPDGTIGWMVLGFVVTGAATWLVLHPPFMRSRPLVRLFRRVWFWLTLVPLALFFYAVWIRVDAYGLTPERILLLAGGIWAAVLAAIFLFRRGDIRLVPALAGLILLLLSVGPWNFMNLPILQQAGRLEALLSQPGRAGASFPPDWSPEEVRQARNTMLYLGDSPAGREQLLRVLGIYGIAMPVGDSSVTSVLEKLGQVDPDRSTDTSVRRSIWRDLVGQPIDVTATPLYLRPLALFGSAPVDFVSMRLQLDAGVLVVMTPSDDPAKRVRLDLSSWLAAQGEASFTQPFLDFSFDGRNYRVAIDSVEIESPGEARPGAVVQLTGQLFSNAATPSP